MSDFLRNQKIVLYGWGVTTKSAAKAFASRGCQLFGFVDAPDEDTFRSMRACGVEPLHTRCEAVQMADLILKSPGIPRETDFLLAAREGAIPCWSDLEFAYRLYGGERMLVVTGSNGKTTTVSLLTHLLRTAGRSALALGNIGEGLLAGMAQAPDDTYFVIEASSFQLAHVFTFAPHGAAILNITPDHLTWHQTMTDYVRCKANVARFQKPTDVVFLNPNDTPSLRLYREGTFPGEVHFIDTKGTWARRLREGKDLWHLLGEHNIENALFALALAQQTGISDEDLCSGLASFQPVAHRLEWIRTVDGVRYINDSKATNVDATVKALSGFHDSVLLIAGGMDKKVPFDDFYKALRPVGKALLLFGETKQQIADGAKKAGLTLPIFVVDTLREAVQKAQQLAIAGDAVLLSPASASWDMYHSYEERGDEFRTIVQSIAAQTAHDASTGGAG